MPHLVERAGDVIEGATGGEERYFDICADALLKTGAETGAIHVTDWTQKAVAERTDRCPWTPWMGSLIKVVTHLIWLKPFRHPGRVVPGNEQVNPKLRDVGDGCLPAFRRAVEDRRGGCDCARP